MKINKEIWFCTGIFIFQLLTKFIAFLGAFIDNLEHVFVYQLEYI